MHILTSNSKQTLSFFIFTDVCSPCLSTDNHIRYVTLLYFVNFTYLISSPHSEFSHYNSFSLIFSYTYRTGVHIFCIRIHFYMDVHNTIHVCILSMLYVSLTLYFSSPVSNGDITLSPLTLTPPNVPHRIRQTPTRPFYGI